MNSSLVAPVPLNLNANRPISVPPTTKADNLSPLNSSDSETEKAQCELRSIFTSASSPDIFSRVNFTSSSPFLVTSPDYFRPDNPTEFAESWQQGRRIFSALCLSPPPESYEGKKSSLAH
ncbi:hypothetical protein P9112_009652 [Eukaryota sp. TZLM1-RC]